MSKPQPILSHMPMHIKQKIVESADTLTKLRLERCSREYKTLSKKSRLFFESLSFTLFSTQTSIRILLNLDCNNDVSFWFNAGSICFDNYLGSNRKETTKETGSDNFCDLAVSEFLNILKDNRLCILNLELSFATPETTRAMETLYDTNKNGIFEKLSQGLAGMERQLHIENILLRANGAQDCLLQVLPHLKPRTLKGLHIIHQSHIYCQHTNFNNLEVAKLDQWKQAKSLTLYFFSMALPVEQWSHFKTIDVGVLTADMFMNIYETLINEQQFRSCRITLHSVDGLAIKEPLYHRYPGCTMTRDGRGKLTITTHHPTFTVDIEIGKQLIHFVKNPIG